MQTLSGWWRAFTTWSRERPFVGGLLMVAADWLGRNLLFPQQLPAGILATLVGGPYLLWLLRR